MAPSHYLNESWFITIEVLWYFHCMKQCWLFVTKNTNICKLGQLEWQYQLIISNKYVFENVYLAATMLVLQIMFSLGSYRYEMYPLCCYFWRNLNNPSNTHRPCMNSWWLRHHVVSLIWVIIILEDGLVPKSTMPSPKPLLTRHKEDQEDAAKSNPN